MTKGLTRDAKHVYQWNGGAPLPSVTTIIGVVDKSGPLVGWAKRITAEAAVDHRAEIEGWVTLSGRDGAIAMLKTVAVAQRDKAANAGTDVHQLAEAIARGQEVLVPEELAPYIASYRGFLDDFGPEFLAAEEMVADLTHGYAGTLDAIARIAGEVWMLDIKTSKGVYPETALQLAAYGHAEFIGRPGTEQKFRIPEIDRWGVIHVRPEKYELIEMEVTRSTYGAFLAAKAIHDWRGVASAGSAVQAPSQGVAAA